MGAFNTILQVPVIAVFTKFDQFRRNVEMDVSDYPDKYLDSTVSQVVENHFQEYYLRPLGDDVRYVQLESTLLRAISHVPTFTYPNITY